MSETMLAPLREDLSLAPGPVTEGAPSWTLYDPARHRFIRLGWLDFEILSRWALRTPQAIVAAIRAETTLRAGEADVASFASFAAGAGLLRAGSAADSARLAEAARGARHSAAAWLAHNYLFLRLRLLNSDHFLTAMLPAVRWMFSGLYLRLLAGVALLGLFLISRQWELYTHSLVELFTLDGLLWMGVALSATKLIHELGHGFAAKYFGCRVPAMGVAFLVLWPVLWTDTTDAWRLTDRRQRLAIDAAGMLAEISVAALASIAWALLPEGPARSAAFVLSSSTWILTLFVNLSPLMRFDGYYLLSDALDVPNLQERAFAHARWLLREILFRPRLPPRERFAPGLARILLAYAYSAWIYRFFLFVGIAFLVYHVAFKALGFVLMGIELWYFVSRPILLEMAAWGGILRRTRLNAHMLVSIALLGLLAAAVLVPWRGRVDAPGLLRATRQVTLYTAEPGRLLALPGNGAAVAAGEAVFTLGSAEIAHDVAIATARLDSAQAELTARSFDPERRRAQQAALAQASEAAAALSQAETRLAALVVHAPFSGRITDIPPELRAGDDLRRLEPLGVLIEPAGAQIEAYVAEADLPRLTEGAAAKFLRVDGPTLTLRVVSIAHASSRVLESQELASTHDGPIAARRNARGDALPDRAIYRVLLAADGVVATRREVGHVVIEASAQSVAEALYRRAIAILLREASL